MQTPVRDAGPAYSPITRVARGAFITESATSPGKPKAATRDEVKAILAALKTQPSLKLPELPLARAAVALIAMLGARPGEARGLRWEDWDRAKEQVSVSRAAWQAIPEGFLFLNRNGRPYTQNKVVEYGLWPALDKLNLPRAFTAM